MMKLFEISKETKVLVISGDVHKSIISEWRDKQSNNFYEVTSSAIARQPRNLINISSKEFWATYVLDRVFVWKGIDQYTRTQIPITYGNNVAIATLNKEVVDVEVFLINPRTYFDALLMQIGLKDFPTAVEKEILHLEYKEPLKTTELNFIGWPLFVVVIAFSWKVLRSRKSKMQ